MLSRLYVQSVNTKHQPVFIIKESDPIAWTEKGTLWMNWEGMEHTAWERCLSWEPTPAAKSSNINVWL